MAPLQLELLMGYYLVGLAVRLSRQRGANTTLWEGGLAQLPLVADEMLSDRQLSRSLIAALTPMVEQGYDKLQIVGGGQDFSSAASVARTLRQSGLLAEALHTDSAWHGPLATVGGGTADNDTLIVLLATDPRFWEDALVDAQIYRTRNAPLLVVVPEGSGASRPIRGVGPTAVVEVPRTARPFIPLVNAVFGAVLARELSDLLA
jgi:glucosamine 6-phosphate synthetase-like amidotransferase/phosphosugar isomerase protein